MGICRRQFGACLLGGAARAALGATNRAKLLVIVLLEQFRPDYLEPVRAELAIGSKLLRELRQRKGMHCRDFYYSMTLGTRYSAASVCGALRW